MVRAVPGGRWIVAATLAWAAAACAAATPAGGARLTRIWPSRLDMSRLSGVNPFGLFTVSVGS
jgi:hypothetical protein